MASDRDLKIAREDFARVNAKWKEATDALAAERAETARLRALLVAPAQPIRRRLPDERESKTHHFVIRDDDGEHDGYITIGLYPDGTPGETFIRMSKVEAQGPYDTIATLISLGLQHGVPLDAICRKLAGQNYSPNGPTANPVIRIAKSPVDYIARYMARRFLPAETANAIAPQPAPEPATPDEGHDGRTGKL